jgi:hypothetical protein
MVKRTTRIVLELAGALVALLLIVGGVFVWRVAQGPVQLDVLSPRIEAALSAGVGNFDVEVGSTVLAWEGWPETFALRVRDLRASRDGRTAARLPAVDLRLSLSALVRGTVAPTAVTGRGANLTIVRDADGLRFGGAGTAAPRDPAAGGRNVSAVVPALLEDLMAAPGPDRPLSYLNRLSVVDTRIEVRDEVLGITWVAPDASVRLTRTDAGIDGAADLAVALGGRELRARAEIGYQRGSGRLDVRASFNGLRPDALAARLPRLERARQVEMTLSGVGEATLALNGEVRAATLEVTGRDGRLAWPELLPDPRPVRRLRARASYDAAARRADLEELEIAFGAAGDGDPKIQAGGTARLRPGGTTRASVTLRATGLNLDRLDAYWPVGMAANAREWVVPNIRTGTAEQAEVTADLRAPADGGLSGIVLTELSGSIDYSGLDVHYLRPMPPVTEVEGTASFSADRFDLRIDGGRLGDLAIPGGDIAITGLQVEDGQSIDIAFGLDGDLRQALQLLDHPRLDLISRLGLDPASVAGRIDRAEVAFQFPLIDDLTFERTQVQADAELSDVRVADFALGQTVRDGDLDLSVDKAGMTVTGPVRLGGVDVAEMTWQERFEAGAEVMTEIEARIPALTAAARARLGVETRPYLDGPLGLDLTYRSFRGDRATVRLDGDLAPARIALEAASWIKPPGNPASLDAQLELRAGDPVALTDVQASATAEDGSALTATGGRAELSDGGRRLARMRLAQLRLGRNDLSDLTLTRTDSGWSARIGGGVLDLAPYLADALAGARSAETGAAAAPTVALRGAKLRRVYVAEDRYVADVTLTARRGPGGRWQRVAIDGAAPARFAGAPDAAAGGARPFDLDYGPGPDGGARRLSVEAADSGALLRALGIYDSIQGGTMRITGRARGPAPTSPLDAEVRIADFRLVNAPTMARILTLGSFVGIRDVMQGEGIAFESLTGDLVFDRGRLSTELLHAYGPALGVTVQGTADLNDERIDLDGVVVPAASTNRVLGNIPVLGRLLTGGEGEGLFAVSYDVTGPLSQPEVSVNPLSALAPGFLRGLFGRLGDLEAGDPNPDWPPEPRNK